MSRGNLEQSRKGGVPRWHRVSLVQIGYLDRESPRAQIDFCGGGGLKGKGLRNWG